MVVLWQRAYLKCCSRVAISAKRLNGSISNDKVNFNLALDKMTVKSSESTVVIRKVFATHVKQRCKRLLIRIIAIFSHLKQNTYMQTSKQ